MCVWVCVKHRRDSEDDQYVTDLDDTLDVCVSYGPGFKSLPCSDLCLLS